MREGLIIQLSDLHFSADPKTELHGVNPFDTFCLLIEQLKKISMRAVFLTGDNSDDGSEASYELIANCLSELSVPIYAIPGNHDNYQNMARVFLKRSIKLDKSISLTPQWQILLLNTQMEKEHWGYLTESETAFLANSLKEFQQKNILIFMHHHPISIASPWMDKYQLRNSEKFLATIHTYRNIQAIAFGHVHQAFDKTLAGKRYLSAPSTHIQFHPGAEKRQFDSLTPGYRWFKIQENFYETGINRLS